MKRARPCAGDKDASVSVMVEKPNRVCHFGSSASASGGCRCTSPRHPPPHPPRAGADFRSEEIQTYTEGREKKGKYVLLWWWWGGGGGEGGGADVLRLPAGIDPIFLQDCFMAIGTKKHIFPQENKRFHFFVLRRSILESSPTVVTTIFS